MKTHIKNLFLVPAPIAGSGSIPAGRARAQSFSGIKHFAGYLLALVFASAAVAQPSFEVSAGGSASGCGLWAVGLGLNNCPGLVGTGGFGRCDNQPVSDEQGMYDPNIPGFFSYKLSVGWVDSTPPVLSLFGWLRSLCEHRWALYLVDRWSGIYRPAGRIDG